MTYSASSQPILPRSLERIRLTLYLGIIALWFSHEECGSLTVQRIGRVGISKELGEKDFKDVDHVKHRGPGLVNNIEADGAGSIVGLDFDVSAGEERTTRQCWDERFG